MENHGVVRIFKSCRQIKNNQNNGKKLWSYCQNKRKGRRIKSHTRGKKSEIVIIVVHE